MKAWRLNGSGVATLQLVDEAPAQPGRGEVSIKMHAAALNYRDLGVAAGQYPSCPGLIPLSDGAGVIDAVGENVGDFAVGDAVVSCFYENWQAGRATAANHRWSLGCERSGVLAEQIILPVTAIVPKPSSLSFREAATLPCAALTAWSALFSEGRLEPGQQVLVQGTGGVAMFALQFAKLAGACVTVLSGSDVKLHRAKALGADHGINYRSNPHWSDAVTELTDGVGVDLVVDLGGADTLAQSLKSGRRKAFEDFQQIWFMVVVTHVWWLFHNTRVL